MKVSIIIPIYNVERYLSKCLESCINQTYHNLEIICVNDGSIDNSKDIIQRYQSIDSRIVLVDKNNEGLPLARKSGIEHASGDYIFHLDGDDNIPLDAIENLIEYCNLGDVDIVIGNYTFINSKGNISNIDMGINHELTGIEYLNYILTRGLFNIWGKLIKRSLYVQNQILFPVNISIGEDLVHSYQLGFYALKIVPCKKSCYYYYMRDTSMSKNSNISDLSDRSILAIDFISEFSITKGIAPFLPNLNAFLYNAIYLYLCSVHSVSNNLLVLNKIRGRIDVDSLNKIPSKLKRNILKIAMINIVFADRLMKILKKIKYFIDKTNIYKIKV